MNKTQLSKVFWAVKLLLVVMIVYVAAGALVAPIRLGETFKPAPASGREPVKIAESATPESETAPDYAAVADSHLFGDAEPAPADAPTTPKATLLPVKEEELNLRLIGTVVGTPDISHAIIEDSKVKKQDLYKIGETVASATVESIEPDRVTLRYHGQTRILALKTDATVTVGRSVEPNSTRPTSVAGTVTPVQLPASSSSRLAQVEALFHKATIEPYVQNGEAEGLRLTGLENIPIALAVGLRNGDVIRTVNGQTLTSKQKAFQVLQKARAQSKIDMQLLRAGKVTDLSFNTR